MPQRNASPARARRPSSEPGGRRQPPGAAAEVPSVLQLGSALGNRSTATLLAGGLLQRKLAIGPAGDPLEREAERAADRVVAAAATPAGSGGGPSTRPVAPVSGAATAAVQRECAACAGGGGRCAECEEKDEELRRASAAGQTGAAGADPARVESRFAALGPGRPLSPGLRGFFEPRFGHDFGAVRLHTGPSAAAAATAARARAFTLRRDVVFGAGEYAPTSRRGRHLIAHELAHVVQQGRGAGGAPVLRRQPEETAGAASPAPAATPAPAAAAPPGPAPAAEESTAAAATDLAKQQDRAAGAAAPRGLIVADEVEPGPGQMTRSAFLDELHVAACSAAEQGLAGTERSAQGCPWIDHYFRVYRGLSAERIEGDLRRYVSSARAASKARDYIAPAADHIRASVRHWAETGELTGVPQGLPGMGLLGAIGGALAGLGGLLFKARSGGARHSAHPAPVAARLGPGNPLPGTVRARMEGAFGSRLGGVRVHTDATAARLAGRFNARAFTVGRHVAFGPGEYRPDTLTGEALLAHELAHTMQQREAPPSGPHRGGPGRDALEREADVSAVGALVRAQGAGRNGAAHLPPGVRPRLRSGLRLQRCKSDREKQIERLGKLQYDFLERKRREEEEKKRKEAEKAAKDAGLPPPAVPPKVTMEETIEKETKKSGFSTHPATAWTSLSKADKKAWETRATAVWTSILTSVKGTELETVLKGKGFAFKPEYALTNGYYAWQDGNTLAFGMSFVKDAEADVKTVWPNIAHEMGGHFEYGKEYAGEIMTEALKHLPEDQRKKWQTKEGRRMFYLRYEYPETEIFAELRERRYAKPESGPPPAKLTTDDPDLDIPRQLKQIKGGLDPTVARAVLTELKRRVDASPNILARDKEFFAEKVKEVFGYVP